VSEHTINDKYNIFKKKYKCIDWDGGWDGDGDGIDDKNI